MTLFSPTRNLLAPRQLLPPPPQQALPIQKRLSLEPKVCMSLPTQAAPIRIVRIESGGPEGFFSPRNLVHFLFLGRWFLGQVLWSVIEERREIGIRLGRRDKKEESGENGRNYSALFHQWLTLFLSRNKSTRRTSDHRPLAVLHKLTSQLTFRTAR